MAAELSNQAIIQIRLALADLNSDFCYFLDNNMVDELVDLFCEDALYTHGKRKSCGQKEIRELFGKRRSADKRTSRHIQSGLRLQVINPSKATGQSVCLTFGANSQPPISPATPYLVADFLDEYQLCEDGRWRIKKRHIERIFISSENKGPVGYSKKHNYRIST